MSKNIVILLEGVAIVGLAVVLAMEGFGSFGLGGAGFISQDKAGETAMSFITENLVNPGTELSLTKVSEESGLYKMEFDIMGQEETAYVTKDGKYLFTYPPVDMLPPEPEPLIKRDVPEVDLFVMSYCPYGNQAEELMAPVAELLGDKANVELHYILYSNYGTGYPEYCFDEEEKYCSMHGIQELNQGVRELCVQKYQKDKLWDFVKAANEQASYEDIDDKWEAIAQSVGIDVAQIKTCETEEAVTLLAQEAELTKKMYPVQEPAQHQGNTEERVSGSPTLVINGMIFDGGRDADAYKEGICSGMTSSAPECEQSLELEGSAPTGSCE